MISSHGRVLAVVATLTLTLAACSSSNEQQVLKLAGENLVTSTFVFEPGYVFSEGLVQLFPEGDEPIEIVDVRSEGMEGDLEFLGAYVAGPEREVNNQLVRSFPPNSPETGPIEPAVGARIGPVPPEFSEAGYQILLGYRVGTEAQSKRAFVSVDYRVGDGKVRTQEEPVALAVCTEGDEDACSDWATSD